MRYSILRDTAKSIPFLLAPMLSCSEKPSADNPNVIIVFIDDFGYGDLACYGNTKYAREPSPATEAGEESLYNLNEDIAEINNLAAQYPDIVAHFHTLVGQVRDDLGDWEYEGQHIRPAGVIDEPFPRLLK